MSMILDQKKEIFFAREPYYLSRDLAKYWNEEIPDTQLIPKALKIIRDIHLFSTTHEITKKLLREIEQKLSHICKMLKGSAKRRSPADPIDREIYRFAMLIQKTIDGGYHWTANKACTALMLFLQDTKYALRFLDTPFRQQFMDNYIKDYVPLWQDYLGDYILLEWQAAEVMRTITFIHFDKEIHDKMLDIEAEKLIAVPSLRKKFDFLKESPLIDNVKDAEEAHWWLSCCYTESISLNNQLREQTIQTFLTAVKKTEPILQKREQELIAMSKQYRQILKEWQTSAAPKDPFAAFHTETEEKTSPEPPSLEDGRPNPKDIEKECSNMKLGDLLRSVLGEEAMKPVEESWREEKDEPQKEEEVQTSDTSEDTLENIKVDSANMEMGDLLRSVLGEERMKCVEPLLKNE